MSFGLFDHAPSSGHLVCCSVFNIQRCDEFFAALLSLPVVYAVYLWIY